MHDIENRLIDIEKKLDKLNVFNEKITSTLELVSEDLKSINFKVDSADGKLDKLTGETSGNFKSVDTRLDEVISELKKINQVTRYEEELKNIPRKDN